MKSRVLLSTAALSLPCSTCPVILFALHHWVGKALVDSFIGKSNTFDHYLTPTPLKKDLYSPTPWNNKIKKWLYPQKIFYSKGTEGRELKLVSSLSAFVYLNIVRGSLLITSPTQMGSRSFWSRSFGSGTLRSRSFG